MHIHKEYNVGAIDIVSNKVLNGVVSNVQFLNYYSVQFGAFVYSVWCGDQHMFMCVRIIIYYMK